MVFSYLDGKIYLCNECSNEHHIKIEDLCDKNAQRLVDFIDSLSHK